MIEVPTLVTSVLAGSAFNLSVSVSSWRGGELLAADVPIVSGAEDGDRAQRVPDRVVLTVPREDRGTVWAPTGEADHPLAANGQRLNVKIGVSTTSGTVEYFGRGWYLIDDVEIDGGSVTVTAVNLLQLVDEARLVSPFQPTGTLGSTLRGLVEPGLTVDLTDAPTDRSVPTGINYDEDRLGAVLELTDAWAAEVVVTESGVIAVEPAAVPTVAVATIRDSDPGAVILRTAGSSSREGGFNVVVARGTATDGGQVQGVAYDTRSTRAYGGLWSPYAVPYFFASPLLTSNAQCVDAANTVLARLQRAAGAEFTVEIVPNPTLQLGDALQLETELFSGLVAVERLQLPYRIQGGDHRQTLTVREVLR